MQLRPVNDCLLVELVAGLPGDSDLILDDEAPIALSLMRVLHTPDYVRDDQEIFLKGDQVVVALDKGFKIRFSGQEYWLVHQQDVLAMIA